MEFKIVQEITGNIISSIQNTGIASVKAITKTLINHTYPVKVINPQTKVEVKGTIIVANQKKLEDQIKSLQKEVIQVKKLLPSLKNVTVSNPTKIPAYPKFPDFPKELKVSNLSDKTEVSNINLVVTALEELQRKVDKLKLNPEIKVEAPIIPAPVVNIPKQETPSVNVEAPDLSSITKIIEFLNDIGVKNPLAVRLSDGQKFYKALEKMAEIYAGSTFSAFQDMSGGESRAILNRNNEVQVTVSDTWDVNDVEKVDSNTTYFGEGSVDGKWRVREVIKDGILTHVRHATIRNNSGYSTYNQAWNDRVNLEYGYAMEAL